MSKFLKTHATTNLL